MRIPLRDLHEAAATTIAKMISPIMHTKMLGQINRVPMLLSTSVAAKQK